MRDFHLPGRSTAFARHGMAATSHPESTLVALDVLRAGGNAVDAAVAASAVQAVVEPGSTGIAGDCFALYAPASGGVHALNGSGHAPAACTIEALAAEGLRSIPQTSPHAVTVPGAIRAWAALIEAHGTRPLGQLLEPAIDRAENGFPITPRVHHDWQNARTTLERSEAGRDFYLPGGEVPGLGRVMRFGALARTLRRIAEEGADAFYEGELPEKMTATLRSFGGRHTVEDFAACRPEWVEPIHATYRGVRVYECPPNGQGVVALLLLNILEQFDLARLDPHGPERFHLEAEAARLAYHERDRRVADPRMVDVPAERLLDKRYAKELAEKVDANRAMGTMPPSLLEPHADTIYLTVVDRDRNACSFINSLYDGFGSGIVCPDTGVIFQSRGRAFRLDPGHPNALAPNKRPMHTIIPGLAFKDGEVWTSFGVMGGDYQPVGHAHLLTNMIDYEMDLQEALDSPRALAYPDKLQLERGIPRRTAEALAELGHDITEADKPLGGGQAITIARRHGVLIGGSDPRKDGLALGY